MAVDEKHVRDSTVWGQPGSEPENRKELVRVVLLDDLADGLNGELVLVHLTTWNQKDNDALLKMLSPYEKESIGKNSLT